MDINLKKISNNKIRIFHRSRKKDRLKVPLKKN